MPMFQTVRVIACLTATVALGCSSRYEDAWSRARPKTYACTGMVSHRGQPLAGALVNFAIQIPDAKRPDVVHTHQAVAFTGPDGNFRLKTFREGDGAVAGTHSVRIAIPVATDPTEFNEPSRRAPASVISKRYADFKSSGLTAEVTPAGPNRFEFTLSD
jgi:hypothetical protein